MHEKSALMCFNIPRGINEDSLYELFCIAGPIESIQAGKSGKSVFIFYEFRESVDTAKEIFKDVKLYGRPIRMFDKSDIENIHAKQEEESNLKRSYEETGDNYDYNEPPAKSQRYEGPPLQYRNRSYHQSAQFSQHQQHYSRRLDYQSGAHSQKIHTGYPNYFRTSDSNMVRAEQSAPKNDLAYRQDLMPDNNQRNIPTTDPNYSWDPMSDNQQCRREEFRGSGNFHNPYEMPVSRFNHNNSHRYGDFRNKNYEKPYDRQRHHDYSKSRSSSSVHFSKNRHHNPEKHRNSSHRDRRQ